MDKNDCASIYELCMHWSGIQSVVSLKNRWPVNSRMEMVQLLSFSDSAKNQLVNLLLPAVCSHCHWLHVYLNEAPEWLWKHMSWLVTPCQMISSVVWRITVLWWYWTIGVVCYIVQSLCGNITAPAFPIHILNIKSSEWKKQWREVQYSKHNSQIPVAVLTCYANIFTIST